MPTGRGALITLLALGAGIAAAPANAATHDVTVRGNAFEPAEFTITQGDTVNWIWADPASEHSATSVDPAQQGAFDSGLRKSGDAPFSFDMNFPGEFKYYCRVHPEMGGRITVLPKSNDPSAPGNDFAAPKFARPKVSVKKRQVRFTLDEDARATVKLRGPTRATIKLDAKAGPNVARLPKRLKRGRYAVVVWATDAQRNRAKAKTVKFRVR